MIDRHGPLGRHLVHVYITEGINVANVRALRKVREHVMFMAANRDVNATACRGKRAYRPNQANGFNEEDIDMLIECLCTG